MVDGESIRKKARKDYQKAVRDLETAKAESERFHNEDKPLFSKWVAKKFGSLLTEIRDLQASLINAQNLIAEVEEEYHLGGHRSVSSAYKTVKHRREHPEEAVSAEKEIDPEEAEDFAREFEDAFGKSGEDYWENLGQDAHRRTRPERHNKASHAGSRLKELYRALARRLHPDGGRALSQREKEWWNETQAAYTAGNVEQLEMILALLEVEDAGARATTISTLHQLTAAFKKSLRALKRQLNALRMDPAWNFSRRKELASLERQVRLTLEFDRDRIKWFLQKFEEEFRLWDKPKRKAPARRTRVRSVPQDEDWF